MHIVQVLGQLKPVVTVEPATHTDRQTETERVGERERERERDIDRWAVCLLVSVYFCAVNV